MNRLNLLYKMDGLLATCKTCEKNGLQQHHDEKCAGCQVYTQLREIGENLGRKKEVAKISLEMYQDYKAQGLSDKEIAAMVGMNHQYLSQLKKQWGLRPVLSQIEEKKSSETKNIKEDKTAEYERLISALRDDLNNYHNQLEEKDELIRNLQGVVEKYEQVNAACEDVENEVSSLREEKNQLQENCSRLFDDNINKDAQVENWKHRYKLLMNQNEQLDKQNKAFREALKLCL